MTRVAAVMLVLVVHLVVLAVASVVVLVFPREAPLDSLVHRRTFQSLLLLLALCTVAQLLVH